MNAVGSILSLSPSVVSIKRVPVEQLPRDIQKDIDKGWAWVVMFAAFLGIMIVNGLCYTVGIYIVEFLEEFNENRALTAWVGSVLNAQACYAGILASVISYHFGCRVTLALGSLLAAGGIILSSFATSVMYLIISYGLITGTGLGLTYTGVLIITGQYFDKRRAFANGFAHTGGGGGVFLFSPLVRYLIDEYTWRGSMFILAGLCLHIFVIMAFMRPLPPDLVFQQPSNEDKSNNRFCDVLRNPKVLIICLSTLLAGASSSAVYILIADYAEFCGTSHFQVSLLYSAIGITTLIGKFFTGLASNSTDVDGGVLFFGTLSIVAFCTWLIPILFRSYSGQMAFALLFGTYNSGPTILWSSLPANFLPLEQLGTGIGIILTIQGVGQLLGPVISGAIFDATNDYAYSSYYAGAVATFASIVILALPLPRTGQNVTLSSKEQQSELPRLKANSSSFINQRNSIPKLTVNGHASNDFDEQSIKYDVQNANSCNNSLRITNGSAIDHSSGGV